MALTRIRVADETWAFTSALYARVNAGLVVTRQGGVLIDTLPFPAETRQMRNYIDRLCDAGIKYVVITQSAADHVYGAYLFPDAELLAHELTRARLQKSGAQMLRQAKVDTPALQEVQLRLPRVVFDEEMVVRVGNKSVHVIHAPGPAPDTCVVHVPEEKVLFTGDLMMHIPMITQPQCDIDTYTESLGKLHDLNLEVIVQGHGDILLRGEVTSSIDTTIRYLTSIVDWAQETAARRGTLADLSQKGPTHFGVSTIPMGEMVTAIHQANLHHLWRTYDPRSRRNRGRTGATRKKA